MVGSIRVTYDAAPEVRVEVVGRGDPRLGRAYVPTDRVSALAYSSFQQAIVVTVPKEAVASRPTVLSLRGERSDGPVQPASSASPGGRPPGPPASFGHVLVEVEPNASAVLVLDHSGSATYADNVEFSVGDGGSLSVVTLQGWADDTVHLSHHHAQLGKDARFKHTAVTLGGDVVRMAPSVRYTGPGGDAELLGLYFMDIHLFYLMARGISYQQARRLVIRGFFGELIKRIDVPSVRARVAEAIEAELLRSTGEHLAQPVGPMAGKVFQEALQEALS